MNVYTEHDGKLFARINDRFFMYEGTESAWRFDFSANWNLITLETYPDIVFADWKTYSDTISHIERELEDNGYMD